MLKTALLTIPRLYAVKREVNAEEFSTRTTTSVQNFSDGGQNSRGQSKHVMAERRRREELKERFVTLRKLVPFATKVAVGSPNNEFPLSMKSMQSM